MENNWNIQHTSIIQKRFIKIKDTQVLDKIFSKIDSLAKNPTQGKVLSGKAKQRNLRSLRFGTNYGEMRLIYEVIEKDHVILCHFIGTREEVYHLMDRWL